MDRRWAGSGQALAWYAAVAAGVAVALWLGVALAGPAPGFHSEYGGPALLDGRVRLDGMWYVNVARSGYGYTPGQQSSVAFFPAFPLAVRALAGVVRDPFVAGMLVSLLAGAVAAVLFAHWCRLRLGEAASRAALGLLLLFPFAWYLYGVVYSEALFLCVALGAFVLLEHDRPVLAGLVAAVASATRVPGIAVPVGLVLVLLQRRGGWRRLRLADAGVLLGFGGLLAWMGWLGRTFGDPLVFSKAAAAAGWNEGLSLPTVLKVELFRSLGRDDVVYSFPLLLQAAGAIGALCLVPTVWRRFGWGYAGFVLVVLGLPLLSSDDFLGFGRYLLPAFPVFAAAGDLLAEKPRWVPRVLAVSGLLLLLFTVEFAQGFWIA